MKKIALINIQIGAYKNYFKLFLRSCEKNPEIDFYFFTDQNLTSKANNIFFIPVTFNIIKARIQSLYDFKINLENPYDLCDYKVAYGELFEKELKEYDFWGYFDTDLIFGQIKNFITDDLLDTYDKLLIRGSFTLFRNSHEINRLYRSILNSGKLRYKEVFSEFGIHHFDEGLPNQVEGINMIFSEQLGWSKVWDEYIFMDLDVYSYRFINADFVNDKQEKEKALNSYFLYRRGQLFRVYKDKYGKIKKEEFMYIHFQKRKMAVKCSQFEEYFIVPNKFINVNTNKRFISKANKNKIYWILLFQRIKNKVYRIMKG